MNGGEGKCMYIDTTGTFRPQNLVSISERFGMTTTEVMDNVAHARCYNTDHLQSLLVKGSAMMSESRYSLLVIDSLIHLFRVEYLGRGELCDRQIKLNQVLRKLNSIADTVSLHSCFLS
jgi:DNA repair protein RAD51